ncbi:two-component system CheB/CheR fusion protein [Litorivivens lipolytica]|uniref:Two-component system CheB/CheR fusion protein n=1 Tax=Litorivivens lipolytica TaxID=1524264 RepID=A0A7W4W4U1_9GAMM|nr:chemotaxis protein CheB [Litorivivens lipolytica]MBB3047470.1 two-component system CheB/CheR fusion protein [Litorivivens lipolytica]
MADEKGSSAAEENNTEKSTSESKKKTGKPYKDELIVVGIGASAGGLEAMQSLVSNLPVDSGFSFLVAQHLSPSYRSMMVDLLEKDSTIPVRAAIDGAVLQPNELYICPPNHNIELAPNDHIRLTSYPDMRHTPRPSVDMLLESIATEKGEHSIGIILSGTGSDGSRGIRAIKAENGIGVVQDPETAKFDGMPNAAINSGNIDLIIPPANIGQELINLLSFPRVRNSDAEVISRPVYDGIIHQLRVNCDVDFRLYKENTIVRRIERRMATLKISTPEQYLKYMRDHKEEASFLFNDMLIGVTSFFRDARAYEVLRGELAKYIQEKETKTLRIWSVGCSTGEEAYSMAMIVSDILGDEISDWKVQIFATDIDKRAITYARNGIYPEIAIQNLPKSMRQKYLSINNDQYEVVKSIKSKLIFSLHDVNRDPPFLRLDLVSCRNLMIYFTMELQRQLLPTFHYALNPRGLLMLGQSESIGIFQEHYRPLSKTAKLYESVFIGKQLPPERQVRAGQYSDRNREDVGDRKLEKSSRTASSSDEVYQELITAKMKDLLLPNAIVINDNQDIMFTEGTNPILVRPEGKPSNNIYKNLHPRLAVDVRSALHQLESQDNVTDTGYINLELNGEDCWVKLIFAKAVLAKPAGTMTIIYCQIERADSMPVHSGESESTTEAVVLEQHRLLARTKEQLQNVIEELEASNEEMQSMNEELQSSNEELQSSNEELETTNEELQSTNEELQTAYSELKVAYEDKEQQQRELLRLRSELEQANTLRDEAERIGRTGSWMWDVATRKFTWSRGCYRVFGLDEKVFHPSYEAFIGVAHPDDRNRLERHLTDLLVNKASQPFVFKAQDSDRNTIIVSMEAVVSFNDLKQAVKVMGSITDMTEKLSFEREAEQSQKRLEAVVKASLTPCVLLDLELEEIDAANKAFLDLTGLKESKLSNYMGDELYTLLPASDREILRGILNELTHSELGASLEGEYAICSQKGDAVNVVANHAVLEVNDKNGQAEKILINLQPK